MAAGSHRDRLGYYRILGLSPDASVSEIKLAYKLLKRTAPEDLVHSKREILKAYEVLRDPSTRKAYDSAKLSARIRGSAPSPGGGFLGDKRVLAACVVLLLGILVFVWLPLYGSRLRTFSPGDRLLDHDGAPFGVVVQMSETHDFAEGVQAPGYLIETDSDKQLRWFPVTDIQATCRRAD